MIAGRESNGGKWGGCLAFLICIFPSANPGDHCIKAVPLQSCHGQAHCEGIETFPCGLYSLWRSVDI